MVTATAPNMPVARTHCKRGHEFTAENTIWNHGGRDRECRACHNARTATYQKDRLRRKRKSNTHTERSSPPVPEKHPIAVFWHYHQLEKRYHGLDPIAACQRILREFEFCRNARPYLMRCHETMVCSVPGYDELDIRAGDARLHEPKSHTPWDFYLR